MSECSRCSSLHVLYYLDGATLVPLVRKYRTDYAFDGKKKMRKIGLAIICRGLPGFVVLQLYLRPPPRNARDSGFLKIRRIVSKCGTLPKKWSFFRDFARTSTTAPPRRVKKSRALSGTPAILGAGASKLSFYRNRPRTCRFLT